jgi:poly(3-hydroxyalkanoate) synthetase
MYLLAGDKDDITLPEQVFDAEKYIGTPKDKIGKGLAQAGHIGLFMGRSVLGKNWKEISEWILKHQ